MKRTALKRNSELRRSAGPRSQRERPDRAKGRDALRSQPKPLTGARKAISPATPAQRRKARAQGCIVCGPGDTSSRCGKVQPAHLIDRSLLREGQDDALAVVGLGARHHREYDDGLLDLLPHLERRARAELAFAVQRFGLLRTLERVTNSRWTTTPTR